MLNILVVGSINMDIINRVHEFPEAGETVKGLETEYLCGGKGSNQAIAASLAGGYVTMIGSVGQDSFANQLLATMQGYGVNTSLVMSKEGFSGLAFINVNDHGENTIILSEGANGKMNPDDIRSSLSILKQTDLLLLQNEIPWETNEMVIEEARRKGVFIILNPAPATSISDEVLQKIDLLILNETEIETITGISANSAEQADEALRSLIHKGAREIILTLGENGTSYMNAALDKIDVPAFRVDAVDTTAAGDTFIGALATLLRSPLSTEEKLRFASAAAAIAVTRKGAANSIPTREEIEQFMCERIGS
ncbi:ribokinase [Paenibacillus sp. YSY-4.3]